MHVPNSSAFDKHKRHGHMTSQIFGCQDEKRKKKKRWASSAHVAKAQCLWSEMGSTGTDLTRWERGEWCKQNRKQRIAGGRSWELRSEEREQSKSIDHDFSVLCALTERRQHRLPWLWVCLLFSLFWLMKFLIVCSFGCWRNSGRTYNNEKFAQKTSILDLN